MELRKSNVLFLDLQTTGAKPDSGNILEIAWSTLHSENIESHLIAQPDGVTIPSRIQAITGIFDEDMTGAIPLSQVLQTLKNYILSSFNQNAIAIIHFARFERPFLLHAYEQIKEEMPFEILCTHEIAQRLLPNLPTRGIKGLAGYFGFPPGDLKRATNHVQATQIIWQGLTSVLAEQNILTFEHLQKWLQETPKAGRKKYEYPLPKEKRLGLPKQPGIYRMISKWGEVLYVGKATSLHDRVNSYFRGQKNRDARKLEMLTQVWDLQVTPVGSPLEAALLETDEIKRLDPPYNVCLKAGNRSLTFFNRDFTSINNEYDDEHSVGPFANALVFDSMIRLSQSIHTGVFDENMFFDTLEPSLIKEGFENFCLRHSLKTESFTSMRSILAVGVNWVRKLKESEESENTENAEYIKEIQQVKVLEEFEIEHSEKIKNENDSDGQDVQSTEQQNDIIDDIKLTQIDIADKFERHFVRAARAYLRTKKLTKLLNADIHISNKPNTKKPTVLKVRRGHVIPLDNNQISDSANNKDAWHCLSVDTYDRMTVLTTELEKLRSRNISIKIITI
ncbi:MAG: GIY-YIG nuclease family protein [Pseudobdellovibrionaceae bacterium]